MKIEHLAIYTLDLEAIKKFYTTYFGAKANEMYHNKTTGLKSYFLSFEDNGCRLEIMTRPEVTNIDKNPFQSGFIHFAISVGSKEEVNRLTEELRNAGYKIFSEPRTTGDGYYESCIFDPENNLVEITE